MLRSPLARAAALALLVPLALTLPAAAHADEEEEFRIQTFWDLCRERPGFYGCDPAEPSLPHQTSAFEDQLREAIADGPGHWSCTLRIGKGESVCLAEGADVDAIVATAVRHLLAHRNAGSEKPTEVPREEQEAREVREAQKGATSGGARDTLEFWRSLPAREATPRECARSASPFGQDDELARRARCGGRIGPFPAPFSSPQVRPVSMRTE